MYWIDIIIALGLVPLAFATPRRLYIRSDETVISSDLTSVPANSSTGPVNNIVQTSPLSSDDTFQFQLLLMNGLGTYHGADTNEILKTAMYIEPGNLESFSNAFKALADKTKADADASLINSNAINSRDKYFACASYYRTADFYLHANWSDPRINEYWALQTECFDKAIAALPVPGQRLTLPAQGFNVEAIFYAPAPPNPTVKRPTLIMGNGYDAAKEELMHFFVFPALARGWNVITYEGPGQSTRTLHPVVDYLYSAARLDVDRNRLALLRNSFGGYLAARAAAFEPRIRALLLDGGIYDAHAAFVGQLSPSLQSLYRSGRKEQLDSVLAAQLRNPQVPSGLRWGAEQGQWAFKIESTYDFLEAVRAYSIAKLTERIQIPTWIAAPANDQFYTGQPELVKAALEEKATLRRFEGAAGYHTQVGATETANRIIFEWLDGVFGISSQNLGG